VTGAAVRLYEGTSRTGLGVPYEMYENTKIRRSTGVNGKKRE